jgi:Na+-driven multidrug efflux pump
MLYVNQAMANIALKGYSVATKIVDGQKLEQQRPSFVAYERNYSVYVALFFEISYILVVIIFGIQMKRPLKRTAIWMILGAGAGLAMVLYARPPVVPQPPF